MEINTNNSSGMMNGLPPTNKDERKVGPIVGALIIILAIIIIILYFFGKRLNTTEMPIIENQANTEVSIESEINSISSESDTANIEKYLDEQLKDIDYSF